MFIFSAVGRWTGLPGSTGYLSGQHVSCAILGVIPEQQIVLVLCEAFGEIGAVGAGKDLAVNP